MAKNTDKGVCTEKFLISVPLPQQTDTYTVISHEDIIQKVENELNNASLEIEDIHYSYSYAGEVALAKVYIKSTVDADMGMLFTWQNSYNKKVKFSCAIGGYIHDNKASLIGTEGLSWIRKHTGDADKEAYEVIEGLIDNAHQHFTKVIAEKERMKAMQIDEEGYGRVMGALYFEHELVTPTQAMAVKKERTKPVHTYTDRDTLWGLYKLLMYGLENIDITRWQGNQQKLHHMIMAEYAISQEEIQEKLAEALVSPLKEDIKLPLSTLPESEEKGEYLWNTDGNEEEVQEVDEDNLVEDPIKLAEEVINGGKPNGTITEEVTDVTAEMIEEAKPNLDKTLEVDFLSEVQEEVEETLEPAGLFEASDDSLDGLFPEDNEAEEISTEVEDNLAEEEVVVDVEASVNEEPQMEVVDPKSPEELAEIANAAFEGDAIVHTKTLTKEECIEEYGDILDGKQKEALLDAGSKVNEPVQIIAPKINLPEKEKEVTRSQNPVTPEDAHKPEEESFLDIQEHDGLTVPEGMVEHAAMVEKRMIILYGAVRPYDMSVTDKQLNVTIEDTFESFHVPL